MLGVDYVFARGTNFNERLAGGVDGETADALAEVKELGGPAAVVALLKKL